MVVEERAVSTWFGFSSAGEKAGRLTTPAAANANVHLFIFIGFILILIRLIVNLVSIYSELVRGSQTKFCRSKKVGATPCTATAPTLIAVRTKQRIKFPRQRPCHEHFKRRNLL